MKILMFGRGVISTVYGWALERAGHSVDFYVRPGRAKQYGSSLKLELLDARKKVSGRRVKLFAPMRVVVEAHSNPEELIVTCRDALAVAREMKFPTPWLDALEPFFAVDAEAAPRPRTASSGAEARG